MASAELRETSLSRCIYSLSEPLPLARAGGKAWHLRQMMELGMSVPAGLVVTSDAFDAFLVRNELGQKIEALLHRIDTKQSWPAAVTKVIDELLAASRIPAEILEALQLKLPQLAFGKVAVRSSAIGEDSAQHSFAGQLDSVLHVPSDIDSVSAALKRCWASYWSPRAIAYQCSRGSCLLGMAVIIQEQVPATVSGVLFTRHPSAAHDPALHDWMLAEYCAGLGDALVSGRVSPGRVLISRSRHELRSEALPETPAGLDEVAALTLANCGRALDEAFGGPQDIEWSIDAGGTLHLLQSRPITSAGKTCSPALKEVTPLNVWSNANVNENFPDPISPLLYSIASLGYFHYFRNLGVALGISQRRIEAMTHPLQNLVGVHGDRLYYNLTNLHAVLRMAPLGDFLADSFNQFVGAGNTEPTRGPLTWRGFSQSRIGQWAEVLRVAGSCLWQFTFVAGKVGLFERTVDQFAAATAPQALERETLPQLLGHLRRFVAIRCHEWLGASLADASAMLSYGLLKRMLDAEFPGDAQAGHNNLLRGLRDVVSSTPAARLWDLSREIRSSPALLELFTNSAPQEVLQQLPTRPEFAPFWLSFRRYLDEWGFRCSGELMLTVASFQERPEGLIEILRAYAVAERQSPVERLAGQQTERERETGRVVNQLSKRPLKWWLPWPRKSFVLRRLLCWTQKAVVLRERARLKQALLYNRCRRIVLAIGGRLTANGILKCGDDVFFLTVQELESLLSGQSMFPVETSALVELRRKAHAEHCRQRPPDTFAIPAGTYWTPVDGVARSAEARAADAEGTLRGSGVCGGTARAPAAVLESLSEITNLSSGRILVTRQTDPGWAPVFPLIEGLVMERGGMLSHGAILAREYGLPTVVGIPDATRRIRPGQIITVSGDRGLVECS